METDLLQRGHDDEHGSPLHRLLVLLRRHRLTGAVTAVVLLGLAGLALAWVRPVGSRTPGRPAGATLRSGARLLLTGDLVRSYDVDTGRVRTLYVPGRDSAGLTSMLALQGADVLSVAAPTGGPPGRPEVYALRPGGTVPLGAADRVFADAEGDSVWLVSGDPRSSRVVRLAPFDGSKTAPVTLPPGREPLAAVPDGLVLGGAPASASSGPEGPGPLDVWQPGARRFGQHLTDSGVFLAAAGGHVLWSDCEQPACQAFVVRVGGDPEAAGVLALPPLPPGFQPVKAPRLSPDGRHWAVLAAEPHPPLRPLAVVVSHLPDSGRAETSTVAVQNLGRDGSGEAPDLRYGHDGWLFVSEADGRGFVAVRPVGEQAQPAVRGLPAFVSFAAW